MCISMYCASLFTVPLSQRDELTTAVGNHIRSLNWGYRVQLKKRYPCISNDTYIQTPKFFFISPIHLPPPLSDVDYFNAQGSFSDAHTVEVTSSQGHKVRGQ